jgi:hypothetical protein
VTDVLSSELKIEGAKYPAAWEPGLRAQLNRIQSAALVIGLVVLGVSVIGVFSEPQQFFFSYLFGYLFWLQLSLGCFLVTMIHQLAGGRWGFPTRRFLEAGFMAMPLMLLLFIPIFFGLPHLYPWARPAEVAADKVLQGRHAYQNTWGFIVRTVFFLGVWIWIGWRLRKWSLEQDRTTDATPTRKMRKLAGVGVVIYSLLGTFASVDWVMSLEKHWYSTMFAVVFIIGQILSALAFSVVMIALFRKRTPLASVVNKGHYHQLGNLLLAFVMFWTYVSFGELLIIYSGDLPHEIDWYLHRIATSWKVIVAVLALFHFFVPFYLLLFRAVSKNAAPLTAVAAVLFLSHIASVYWMVMPTLHPEGLRISWLDFAMPIGIGGLWVAVFLANLKAAPLLLQQDPGLQFAFKYER